MNFSGICSNYYCLPFGKAIFSLALLAGFAFSIWMLALLFRNLPRILGAFSLALKCNCAQTPIWLRKCLNAFASFAKRIEKRFARIAGDRNFHFLALFLLALAFVSREILVPSGHWSEEAWLGINGELAREIPNTPAMHHTWYTTIFLYTLFAEILSPANLGLIINARIVTAALFSLAPIFLYLFSTKGGILTGKRAFFASVFMYFLPLVSNYATFGVWPELIAAFFVCMFLFVFSATKRPVLLGLVAGVGIGSKLIFLYFLIPFLVFYALGRKKLSPRKLISTAIFSGLFLGVQTIFGNIPWVGLSRIVDFEIVKAYFSERIYTIASGGYFLNAFDGYPYKGPLIAVYYLLLGAVFVFGAISGEKSRGLFLAWLVSILFLFVPVAWVVPGHLIPTAPLFSVILFSLFRDNRPFLILLAGIAILLAAIAFAKEDVRYNELAHFAHGSHPAESYLSENLKNSGRKFVLFDPDYAFCFERKWSREIFLKTVGMHKIANKYGLIVPNESQFNYVDEIFVLPKGHYSGETNAEEISQISDILERRAFLIYEEGDGTKFNVFIGGRFPISQAQRVSRDASEVQ